MAYTLGCMRRAGTLAWFGLCLGLLVLRLAIGPEVGVWFHELIMIIGFPLAPLLWKGSFELMLALMHGLGSAAELSMKILGQGVTWVGFPLVVYLQWFVLVPRIVRWGSAKYRGAQDAT